MRLALEIGEQYLPIGILLGLPEDKIEALRVDKGGIVECQFSILTTWRNKYDNPDSLEVLDDLLEAFKALHRRDLVKLVRRSEYV